MTITKKALRAEHQWIQKYNSDPEYKQIVNSLFGIQSNKAEKAPNGLVSEGWKKMTSKGGKEVSKSDFILDGKYGVSFKNGPGRATSANYNETKAIFMSVLNNDEKYKNNAALSEKVKLFFNTWSPFENKIITERKVTTTNIKKGVCTHPELSKYIETSSYLDKLAKQIRDEYNDFTIDVMSECLTGKNKFSGSLQEAKFYLRCNKDNLDEIEVACWTDSNKFKEECKKYLKVFSVAMKSSSGGRPIRDHWIRFM